MKLIVIGQVAYFQNDNHYEIDRDWSNRISWNDIHYVIDTNYSQQSDHLIK